MKPLFPITVALVFGVFTADAFSAPKGKGKERPRKAEAAAMTKPDSSSPREALQPYIVNVDQLLAIERPKGRIGVLLNQAPSRLASLRQQFVAEREKAAEADRGKFNAAIATCDALTRALDERQKTAGEMQSSAAVKGSTDLGARRKDNLAQGVDGGDRSKAVGSVVERDRERAEHRAARRKAGEGDAALSAMSANRWNQRAIELRKQITESYGRISG